MSVWEDSANKTQHSNNAGLTDISFKLNCTSLPVDHTAALTQSIYQTIPWAKDLPGTGIHPVHVAGSQNGWQRPENNDELLLLSKRTRLRLRIIASKSEEVLSSLTGSLHSVNGHELEILQGTISPLKPVTTLFSRQTVYLQDKDNANEDSFIQHVIRDCNQIGFQPNKILCGRTSYITSHEEQLLVRSVMLADIPVEHSLLLQDHGLGDHRLMGCGILIPHKDTGAVN